MKLNEHTLDEQIDRLRDAIQRYLLVVLKNQHDETPQKNWELLNRLSPDAPKFTPEEWAMMFNPDPKGAGILVRAQPASVQVTLEHSLRLD